MESNRVELRSERGMVARARWAWWILILLASLPASGQQPPPRPDETTNAFLEKIRRDSDLVGLACCVIKRGEIVALGAAGTRKAGSAEPLTVDDKLHLGSCTKAMTATIAAQLVEEDRIAWETRLLEVFPELEGKIHVDYQGITLLDLLTHQAGVPRNNVGGWPRGNRLPEVRFELIERSLRPRPERPIGEFDYSNLGYITAGAMLEKVTGQPWEKLMEQRLFVPLKMKSAGFGPPSRSVKPQAVEDPENSTDRSAKSLQVDQPWGHQRDKQGKWVATEVDNPPLLGPAGTVHCSIIDWARFVSLHLSHAHRQPELLRPETLKFLQRPRSAKSNACGWFALERSWSPGPVLTHNGSNTHWFAIVWAAPQLDFAVLTVTNGASDGIAEKLDQVSSYMVGRYAR